MDERGTPVCILIVYSFLRVIINDNMISLILNNEKYTYYPIFGNIIHNSIINQGVKYKET